MRSAFNNMYQNGGINDVYQPKPQQSVSRPSEPTSTPTPTQGSAAPRTYNVNDGIGIPGRGNLVFEGVKDDGYLHVRSTTTSYRVPTELGNDKDAIRGWAIKAVENGSIGTPLYQPQQRASLEQRDVQLASVSGNGNSNTSTESRSIVTPSNRELTVAMVNGVPEVSSKGEVIARLKDGTTLDKAVELVQMPNGPFKSLGTPVAGDVTVAQAVQPPKREMEQPKMSVG